MRARGGLAAIACAGLALFALPAAANAARPGYEVRPKRLQLSISLEATNGYQAEVKTEGDQVTLGLRRGDSAAAYTVAGRVSLKRIEADFGSFGKVSARLVGPLPKPQVRQDKSCRGRAPIVERGLTLRGSFEFSGEGGFSEVDAHRAEAVGVQSFRQICKRVIYDERAGASGAGREERLANLTLMGAKGESAGRTVSLLTLGVEESLDGDGEHEPELIAIANVKERHENVAIARAALLTPTGEQLQISAPRTPISETIALPSPFFGTASFLESSGAGAPASWTGDLRVSLPGAPEVALTGPEFQASACRAPTLLQLKRCAAKLDPQESGSQSQALREARASWLR